MSGRRMGKDQTGNISNFHVPRESYETRDHTIGASQTLSGNTYVMTS
jgi:hypothetical protein